MNADRAIFEGACVFLNRVQPRFTCAAYHLECGLGTFHDAAEVNIKMGARAEIVNQPNLV